MASIAFRITRALPANLAVPSLPCCASPGCLRPPTLWQRWWSRNEGIACEADWYCSPECFSTGLAPRVEALARAPIRAHVLRQRFPLGLILLEQGIISQHQLQAALRCQRQAGAGRIGEWLRRNGAATEADIASTLALQQNCPVFSSIPAPSFPAAMQFPLLLIRCYGGVPLYFSGAASTLYLGFNAPLSHSLLRAAAHILRCCIEPCIVTESLHRAAVQRWGETWRGDALCIEQCQSAAEMTRTIASYAEQAKASGCRLARCEQHLWARLFGDAGSLDLLFRVPAEDESGRAYEEFTTSTIA